MGICLGLKNEKIVSPIRLCFQIFVAIILVLIQIAIYYLLFIGTRQLPYIYLISFVISLVLVIYLYNNHANVSYKILWTIIILGFSVTGPLLYICFGNGNNIPKRKYKKINGYLLNFIEPNDVIEKSKIDDLLGSRYLTYLHNTTGFYPFNNQGEEFYPDGLLMFKGMLDAIDKAERYIFLEYFIVASGVMLDELILHLEMAKSRGVEIKFLYDYVGCNVPKILKRKDKNKLIELTNNNFVSYNPLGINLNLGINYRDHRKILLIDGDVAFVGGINIADEYIHKKEKYGFWRDNGMKITGDACYNYLLLFAQNWYMSSKEMLDVNKYKSTKKYSINQGYIFPFGDGPNNRISPAYDIILKMINSAKEKIYISTPYLIIDNVFLKAIADQAKSGLEVIILVPEIADKKLVYLMTENNFDELISAGVKIYKLKNGFNHAKTIVIDDKYSIVGTINIDYRSLFLHFECCNLLVNTPSINEISKDFIKSTDDSILVTKENDKKFKPIKKLISFFLSLLSPLF